MKDGVQTVAIDLKRNQQEIEPYIYMVIRKISKNAVSERWCSDSRLVYNYGNVNWMFFCLIAFHEKVMNIKDYYIILR